jgi:sulfonate transport system permease protein
MTAQSPVIALQTAPVVARRNFGVDRLANNALPLIVPLAILFLWLLNSRMGWLPPQVLPSPGSVVSALTESVATGELATNVGRTLLWLLVGYMAGTTLGALIGIGMGLSQPFEDYVSPTFKAISYVPVLGWLPLWLVLLGVGDALKIVLVAQATLSPVVFNVRDGIRNVPPSLIELGRVLNLTPVQQLRRIILPSAFPSIWSGIRFGLTKAWLALVAVELLASTEGLGFMMVNARALYQLDVMFVSVVAIAVIGFALDRGLEAVERRVLAWRDDEEVVL